VYPVGEKGSEPEERPRSVYGNADNNVSSLGSSEDQILAIAELQHYGNKQTQNCTTLFQQECFRFSLVALGF